MMGPHKNLVVWQKAMSFVTEVYRSTKHFPKYEQFGLVDQLRRASISVVSNIAEGYGRSTNGDLLHYLHMSLGSSNEIDCQLEIAYNLEFLSVEEYNMLDTMNDEINRMLRSLIYKRNNN